jgi:N-acetylglucosamine-6-sulfatase
MTAGCDRRIWKSRANVLVIYLDDMRRDGLQFMPKTRALFKHEFTEARANGGACTDTRLGLFTGTLTRNHPWDWKYTVSEHDAAQTWGPWMRAAGYHTGLFGKYITVADWTAGIQPGWEVWRTYAASTHLEMGYSIDTGVGIIQPAQDNLTYLADELVGFMNGSPLPWFASWNPHHPHTDTFTGDLVPFPEHANAFADLDWPVKLDEDITGKPKWVQKLPPLNSDDVADIKRAALGQARVLAGVDDAIERIFTELDAAGMLDDTFVFLSSDQGVHYGEHRWGSAYDIPAGVQKQTLYDPVLRIPMLATGPDFHVGTTAVNVTQADITATVAAIGGVTPTHALDGIDLRKLSHESELYEDRTLLIQAITAFTPAPSYDGVVTGTAHALAPRHKFARLATGEYELYDLAADPDELVNLAVDPAHANTATALEAELDALLARPSVS